jgi:hypothetical protein
MREMKLIARQTELYFDALLSSPVDLQRTPADLR